MSFADILKTVYFNLRANKGRSILSILGIVIGISSVIIIISAGAGAQGLILNQIKSIGSNVLSVMPGKSEEKGPPVSVFGVVVTTLTSDDAEALKKIPHIENVSGSVRGSASVKRENKNADTTFVGVSASYPVVRDANAAEGRFFSEEEERSMARVAVIGSAVKKELFGESGSAIGERIRIKKENFTVIGVLEERGVIAFQNEDDQILIPLKTAQKLLLGINHVSAIIVKASDSSYLSRVAEDIENLLRERHKINNPADDDFTINDPRQALEALTTVTDALKFFLAGIAAVSLLVGGIGIMNIMLISVTERTREIGLRKAIGASNKGILLQFLLETAAMSSIGGMIGIIIGIIITFLISTAARYYGYDWNFLISIMSIILAVSVSAAVGFVFGLWPAWQAAKKEPIEALRYE